VRDSVDLEPAFATLAKRQVNALIAAPDIHLQRHASEIARSGDPTSNTSDGLAPAWTKAEAVLSYSGAVGTGVPYQHAAS